MRVPQVREGILAREGKALLREEMPGLWSEFERKMTPNNPISKETQEKIPVMLERYSIGKTAKELGICDKTVKKYADRSD